MLSVRDVCRRMYFNEKMLLILTYIQKQITDVLSTIHIWGEKDIRKQPTMWLSTRKRFSWPLIYSYEFSFHFNQ